MNKTATGAVLAGILAIITTLAANGKGFAEGLTAVWLFFVKLGDTAPLGLTSWLMALALAVVVQASLTRWLPLFRCTTSRDLLTDIAAFIVGFGVMYVQVRTINGMLLGALAGFIAPYVYKSIHAVVAIIARRLKKETADGLEKP